MAESLKECCCGSALSASIPGGARLVDGIWKKIIGGKNDNPYRDVNIKFENGFDSEFSDDDVDKPTFTLQPSSRNPLTTEDISAEKQKNKYTWTLQDKSHKPSSMGNKNIAEWIEEQVKPLDGSKTANGAQNWSSVGKDTEAHNGLLSDESDAELLQS